MKKNYFVLFLILMLFFSFCSKQEEKKSDAISIAKFVHSVTSGVVFPDSKIRIRFRNPLSEEEKENINRNKESIIVFDPEVEGETVIISDHAIEFKPEKSFNKNTKYLVKLNLYKIFKDFKEGEFYEFEINVAGKEVSFYEGSFELTEKKNPNEVYYKAKIVFTCKTDLSLLKKSLKIVQYDDNNEKEVDFELIEMTNREFLLKTDLLRRKSEPVKFKLIISKMPVDISNDFIKKFVLLPLKEFKVLGVRTSGDVQRAIIVDFSDKIEPKQNFSSLVNIKGYKGKLSFKVLGDKLKIYGNFTKNEYVLTIKGVRSKYNVAAKDYNSRISLSDIKPDVEFLSKGAFMPTSLDYKLGFRTINVKKVTVVVKKIFESNLGLFLQDNFLLYEKTENDDIDYYEMNRVGITVVEKELKIGNVKNKWIYGNLDLKKMFVNGERGIFEIGIKFTKKDILYKSNKNSESSYDSYYDDPYSYGYYYDHGKVYKTLILTNIGLTLKKAGNNYYVFANNLINSRPMSGVKVILRTFQNQIITEGETNGEGIARFLDIDEDVFYIEAIKDGQRSFIKLQKMKWETSSFEVDGKKVKEKGIKSFIYTERGVYRPGDEVNLNIILRDKTNTFPENHPVLLKVFNPRNQLVFKIKNNKAIDGFYHFKFKTDVNDLTGTWSAVFFVGDNKFYHDIKIETVVPERLKIDIKPEKKILSYNDSIINADINVKYLFGAPGADLKAEAKIIFGNYMKKFKRFNGFVFNDEQVKFKTLDYDAFDGNLDKNGNAKIRFELPDFSSAPSSISALLKVKAFEKSGKSTEDQELIIINPYKYYIGIRMPSFDYGYAEVGKNMNIEIVLVDEKGNPVIGKSLKYKIYRNERVWWWEYDDRVSYKLKYKKDYRTELVNEGEIISKPQPFLINFKPEQRGKYLIEVYSDENYSQRSSRFFNVSYWGDTSNVKNAGVLVLKTDKKSYAIGEKAKVIFPCPEKSTVLLSVEKADKVLFTKVIINDKAKKQKEIEFEISEDMVPNVYASISIIQPHSRTLNDRPIRLYGIIPLKVEKPDSKIKVDILTDKYFKPGKKFKVRIKANLKRKVQYTIAVVDEGLLSLTDFETPSPWKEFYAKQMLLVDTFDLYSFVIGVNNNDITKLFAIGGDESVTRSKKISKFRKSQLGLKKAKRFKPVSMFKGPLFTDENGNAEIEFEMPNYFGAVRVMVVVVDKESYGNAEKTVPVKDDLILLTTIPRVIGVGDKFVLSSNLFVMNSEIKDIKLGCKVSGPLKIVGKDTKKVKITDRKEIMEDFLIEAKKQIGVGKIEVFAKSGKFKAFYKTEIEVRANSSRVYGNVSYEMRPDSTIKIQIPDKGIKGTNNVKIVISSIKKLNIGNRFSYLIRYPYGCIEQTVSSVFPQLFLKDYFATNYLDKKKMDNNINEGIKRLQKFQIFDGSFSYWPGEKTTNDWGSIYGAHFLVEARKRGYYIDDDLYNNIIDYLNKRADNDNNSNHLILRAYRLYVLSMTDRKNFSAMNLLKENQFSRMNNVSKWLLIGAYYNCGYKDLAKDLSLKTSTDVPKYSYSYYSYGSSLRDYAVILDVLNLTGFRQSESDRIYDYLIKKLSSEEWYSTQTLGYSLLAIGKYFENNFKRKDVDNLLKGYIELPKTGKIKFESNSFIISYKIKEGFGKDAEIFIDKKTTSKRIFINVEWSAIPLLPNPPKSNRIDVGVIYLNEKGKKMDIKNLERGKSFWVFGGVKIKDEYTDSLNDVVFVYMLPAGWEVENPRMKNTKPEFYSRVKDLLSGFRYLDVRDDRLIFFFDIRNRKKTAYFLFKVNAVYPGTYLKPPMTAEAMYDSKYSSIGKSTIVKIK